MRLKSRCRPVARTSRLRRRAARHDVVAAAPEHRPDVSRQPRLGRSRRRTACVRGVPTPRIDRIGAEGIRLNNFNVEFSCTVSRAALMTGRYAIRSGAAQPTGITLWEVTIAEALKSLGYATALFGKWHLGGDSPGKVNASRRTRASTSSTAFRARATRRRSTTSPGFDSTKTPTSFIWEGKTGEPSRNVQAVRPRRAGARSIAKPRSAASRSWSAT